MCLAIPGKVMGLDGATGRVAFGEVERLVGMDLVPEARPGDYVLVHAGFAIQRLDAEEAAETLRLLAELEAAGEDPGDPPGAAVS
jgi:hydrogenase expression/formation protein HypC